GLWGLTVSYAVERPQASGQSWLHPHAGGSSTMNVAPLPNSLSHQTRPPIASTIFFTIDKPRPVECSPPVGFALSRADFPKSFFGSSALRPGPSSRTSQRVAPDSFFKRTEMVLPGGEYFTALETRFSNT